MTITAMRMDVKKKSQILLLLILQITSSIGSPTNVADESCGDLPKLGVLPGFGWDDLRSIEMAPVSASNYKECKKTLDGKYVIPDHTFAIPIKKSEVELYSEIIESWANYSSMTSKSMSESASADYSSIGSLSASFSQDYQSLKQRQVDDKSITIRTHARYTLYKIGVSTAADIDTDLLVLFQRIFNALHKNDEETADLLVQFIIRDYGTHFIRQLAVGAIVSKEDYILRKYASSYADNSKVLKASASASFLNIFKFGTSYEQKTEDQDSEGYARNTTFSKVESYGGTLFKPVMNVSEWIDSIGGNVVSIDRWGDPLYLLATPETFPNVPINFVKQLREKLERAIYLYYSRNSHKGCMDLGSKNFDYNANVDGVCDPPDNKYYFGGVYQTCENPAGFEGQDFCAQHNMMHQNIYSGSYSCKPPYFPVLLRNGNMKVIGQQYYKKCSGAWFWRKCHQVAYDVLTSISYSGYWCAATAQELTTNNTGEMFGGLFTSKADNPVTGTQACPPTFLNVKFLQDLHVCVGTDYELGYKYSIPFGGFFSCQSGNPLVKVLDAQKTSRISSSLLSVKQIDALLQYCPKGYTQHAAVIEENCLVYYCVQAGSFRQHGDMPIVLPPFQDFTNTNGTTWKNVIYPEPESKESSEPSNISISGVALGVFLSIVFLGAVIGVVFAIRKLRRQNSTPRDAPGIDDETEENQSEDANLLSP